MQGQPRYKWLAGSDRNERVLKRLTQIPLTVFSDWHSNILHNMPFMSYTTCSYCSERDIFAFEQYRTYCTIFYVRRVKHLLRQLFLENRKILCQGRKDNWWASLGLLWQYVDCLVVFLGQTLWTICALHGKRCTDSHLRRLLMVKQKNVIQTIRTDHCNVFLRFFY